MMKAGRVVRIRVNPKDCLAVVDVLKKVGLLTPGMSFAQAVSAALASSLETFRAAGTIPEHDGFDYSTVMAIFPPDRGNNRRKMDITRQYELVGSKIKMPAVEVNPGDELIDPETSDNPQIQRLYRRLKELEMKRDADPENFSPQEQEEFDRKSQELAKLI